MSIFSPFRVVRIRVGGRSRTCKGIGARSPSVIPSVERTTRHLAENGPPSWTTQPANRSGICSSHFEKPLDCDDRCDDDRRRNSASVAADSVRARSGSAAPPRARPPALRPTGSRAAEPRPPTSPAAARVEPPRPTMQMGHASARTHRPTESRAPLCAGREERCPRTDPVRSETLREGRDRNPTAGAEWPLQSKGGVSTDGRAEIRVRARRFVRFSSIRVARDSPRLDPVARFRNDRRTAARTEILRSTVSNARDSRSTPPQTRRTARRSGRSFSSRKRRVVRHLCQRPSRCESAALRSKLRSAYPIHAACVTCPDTVGGDTVLEP
jgi:hypothetical protein